MGGDTHFKQFICNICHQLPRSVMEISCCNSIVCKECAVSLLKTGGIVECPICLHKYVKIQPNVPLQKIVNQVQVKCRFSALGCQETLSFQELEQHELHCGFSLVECPNHCEISVLSKDLEEHQKSKCPMRIVTCPNEKCDQKRAAALLELHSKTECEFVKVNCPNCFKEIKRKNLNKHMERKCPETFVSCPYSDCGCCEKILRKQLPIHEESSAKFHLQLVLKTVNKQQCQIEILTQELNALKKSSIGDFVQDTADIFANSFSKPNIPSWLSKWEHCKFNLIYLWIAGLIFLQVSLMMKFVYGHYVSPGYFMSSIIYGIFMAYYYFIHSMNDVAWYMKFGASTYFILAWFILSHLLY